jgi:energy-coupling factor transport system permease protein
MLKGVTIGQFVPGESPVHKLDPRTKLTVSLVFVICIFLVESLTGFALTAAFLLSAILLSTIPFSMILRGLRPIIWLLFFTWILHAFTDPGKVIYALGPLHVTMEGVQEGFVVVVRLALLMFGTTLVTLTTSPMSLTDGLEYLLWPLKKFGLPVSELAMMMTIALRFIPTLLDEAERIMKAQEARGADFVTGSLSRRVRAMIPLLVPLFISSFQRADELAIAMEARAYRGGEGRTRLHRLKMRPLDWVLLVLSSGVFVYLGIAF